MKRVDSLKNKLMTINIPTYIVIKDKELRYQAINDYTMNILRLKSEHDLIGKSDFECPWANMAEDIRKYDQQIFEGKTVLHSKVNRYHVNGPRPIIVNKFPLLNRSVPSVKKGLFSLNCCSKGPKFKITLSNFV